ncbi:MAG: VWA domain-containing protein [Acidobacteria bacterium]|nr:VWA domain-containing protein [Acidobacteriota bacterium]
MNRSMHVDRLLITLLLILATTVHAESQSSPPTDRTKTFGSSLTRDPKQSTSTISEDTETIRVETNLVVSNVLVLNDKGSAILGLTKNDFVVTEDGVSQSVELFANTDGKPVPRSIILIVDYSGSIDPFFARGLAGAKALIGRLGAQDKMAIVTDDVSLICDFTNDRTKLNAAIDSVTRNVKEKKHGNSFQYSALMATLRELIGVEDLRPIIIFQTDGDEAVFLRSPDYKATAKRFWDSPRLWMKERTFSFEDVRDALERSRVTLYNVIPGIRFAGRTGEDLGKAADIDNQEAFFAKGLMWNPKDLKSKQVEIDWRIFTQNRLLELGNLSGGYTEFLQRPEDADEIYTRILKTIDNRYVLGYYPEKKTGEPKRRSVKIEVKGHPEFIVIGRKTYLPAIESP